MLIMFVMLMVCSMVIFPNVLMYTISLLLVSISFLFYMVLMNYVSTLMFLLMVIVYVGAMMILIGYICAVCPNFMVAVSFNYFYFFMFLIVMIFLSIVTFSYNKDSSKFGTLLDYFFSSWGSPVFFVVAVMLFMTLIMVTSQYSSPQGPFRSA